MKRNISKVKCIMSCFMTIVILFANSATFISSAYGGNIGDANSGIVYIRNVNSGKYIDVPGGTVANGKEVQLYEGVSSVAQRWNVVKESDGFYSIRSAIDQRYYLSVKGDKDVNGAKIVLKYISTGSTVPDSAKFFIFDLGDWGCAFLISKINFLGGGSELRGIDAQQAGTANGTKLLHYTLRDTLDLAAHQLWVIENDFRFDAVAKWDLVDLGGHCDWDGTTKYMSLFNKAVNTWNSYMGVDRFRPDAWNRVQDVKISDKDYSTEYPDTTAETSPYGKMVFYTTPMDKLESDLQRQKVIMHELGHALGLADHFSCWGNIMSQGPCAYGTSLSLDDKISYQYASEKY